MEEGTKEAGDVLREVAGCEDPAVEGAVETRVGARAGAKVGCIGAAVGAGLEAAGCGAEEAAVGAEARAEVAGLAGEENVEEAAEVGNNEGVEAEGAGDFVGVPPTKEKKSSASKVASTVLSTVLSKDISRAGCLGASLDSLGLSLPVSRRGLNIAQLGETKRRGLLGLATYFLPTICWNWFISASVSEK